MTRITAPAKCRVEATNVDDHLWSIGFLYAGDGKCAISRDVGLGEADLVKLAPAFEHQDAQAARALTR